MLMEILLSAALLATPSNALPVEELEPYDGPAIINSSQIDLEDLQNCFLVECHYNNQTRYIIFPDSARETLYIDADGNLLNFGSSSVTGQMLNINLSLQYDAYYVTISPVTTNSFSSDLYSHGSYIQLRHYYQEYSSGRYHLENSSEYVNLVNCKVLETDSTSWDGEIRNILTIIFILLGVLIVGRGLFIHNR